MMGVLTGIAFVISGGSIMIALVASSTLFRLLYSRHKSEWERLGCPAGMWSVPQELLDAPTRKGWESSVAGTNLLWAWLFKNPEWIEGEPEARQALRRLRLATIVGYAGMAAFLVLFFVTAF